jgi:hypothetical protein
MATYTNFDDEIFAQQALEGYVSTLCPLNSFSTDFGPSPLPSGNTVLVPLIGSLTATTFGGSYSASGGTLSAVTVTINRHKVVAVGQDDLTFHGSSIARLERFAYQQGQALAVAVLQDIASLWTTANFSLATAVSLADFGVSQIRAGRLALSTANVPLSNRSLILDVDPFDNLLGISNFLQVNLSGSQETLRDGKVGRALGFDIFECGAVPGTASVCGFFAHPTAIAIAMRYLAPQEGHTYDMARAVSDPGTGATFGIRAHYDNATGSRYINLEANYGYSVGISNGGRVLKRLD